ncbi:MAG: acyl-CoA dehydrogenase family protein [Deltaproteobacteria bacterium]
MQKNTVVDFGFSQEQEQLKNQVRRFLDSECPLDRVRELVEAEESYDTGLWGKMAELGWQALVVPEAAGGLGLKWEDLIVVCEEMGRSLFPSPFLATAVAARAIARLGDAAQTERWLADVAGGSLVATLAVLEESDVLGPEGIATLATADGDGLSISGTKMFVPYGQAAGLLVVAVSEAGGISLFAVPADAEGVSVEALKLTDPTQSAARITLDSVKVGADARLGDPGKAGPEVAALLDAYTVGMSAEMVGAADAAVVLAAEYAKVRKQFGQPIGRFQGVKHRLAECFVATEAARSLVYYASWAIDNLEDATSNVSMAKAYAAEALDRAGEEGVQLHGAIGFTWECDAHFYYKRGRYCRNVLGSPEYHYERVLAADGI